MRALATRLPATPQGPSTYHSGDAPASEDRRDHEKRPRHLAPTKTEGNCSPSDRRTRHHRGAKPDRYHTHQRIRQFGPFRAPLQLLEVDGRAIRVRRPPGSATRLRRLRRPRPLQPFVRPLRLRAGVCTRERRGTAATTDRRRVFTDSDVGKTAATSGSRTTATRSFKRAADGLGLAFE